MGVLDDLLGWVKTDKPFGTDQLPIFEVLKRMSARVSEGKDERKLIIEALEQIPVGLRV